MKRWTDYAMETKQSFHGPRKHTHSLTLHHCWGKTAICYIYFLETKKFTVSRLILISMYHFEILSEILRIAFPLNVSTYSRARTLNCFVFAKTTYGQLIKALSRSQSPGTFDYDHFSTNRTTYNLFNRYMKSPLKNVGVNRDWNLISRIGLIWLI